MTDRVRLVLEAALSAAAWSAASVLVALTLGVHPQTGAAVWAAVAVVAVVPSVWIFRATLRGCHLKARNAMHLIDYGLLVGWVVPSALLHVGDGSVHAWAPLGNLAAQVFVVPGVLAFAAVAELSRQGAGSVVPLEAPARLVVTGPFAYLANPIQSAKVLTLMAWAAFALSWTLLAAALVLLGVGAMGTEPLERRALDRRFGAVHRRYRAAVHAWWPRWRPWIDPSQPCARLELAASCDPCEGLARWLKRQAPSGLEIVVAADLPRMRYVGPGGTSHGVLALCHALEHVQLGWAVFGWAIRLPVVRSVAEMIYEASVPREMRSSPTCAVGSPRAASPRGRERHRPSRCTRPNAPMPVVTTTSTPT